MSAFSEQLRETLEAADMSQSALADLSKVSQSNISRYLRGEVTPSQTQFGAMLDAIPETLHFELIVARLTDELPPSYRNAVTIIAQGGAAIREHAAGYMPKAIARDLRRALGFLAEEAVNEPAVRELIISLARTLGHETEN